MLEIFLIILVTGATALISLAGGLLLLSGSKLAHLFQRYGVIFAAVILLYAVFGDIIPDILEDGALPVWQVALFVAAGTALCFALSFIIGRFHKHGEAKEFHNKKQAYAMLIVDVLHTAMDGIVIGASFAASIPTGLVTAAATAAHEIPQEVGDFAIMLRSKLPRRKILQLQVATALVLVPFALLAYFVGEELTSALPTLLAFTAGFLLYIAINEIWSIIKVLWAKIQKTRPKVKEIK